MSDERRTADGDERYDPPRVDQIATGDGPAVTAADGSPPSDQAPGPEWRPSEPPEED